MIAHESLKAFRLHAKLCSRDGMSEMTFDGDLDDMCRSLTEIYEVEFGEDPNPFDEGMSWCEIVSQLLERYLIDNAEFHKYDLYVETYGLWDEAFEELEAQLTADLKNCPLTLVAKEKGHNPGAVCPRCLAEYGPEMPPLLSMGSSPKCAFPGGQPDSPFVSDNWNCGTMNEIREYLRQHEWKRTLDMDRYGVVVPVVDEDSEDYNNFYAVVDWYKDRGTTSGFCRVTPDQPPRPATFADADLLLQTLRAQPRDLTNRVKST